MSQLPVPLLPPCCCSLLSPSSPHRVKGLPTRKKYKFRVLAENLAGTGKPSKETDPILVKDPIGQTRPCTIELSSAELESER